MKKACLFFLPVAIFTIGVTPVLADIYDVVWYNNSITGQVLGNDMSQTNVYVTPLLLKKEGTNTYFKVFCIDLRQTAAMSMDLEFATNLNQVPVPGPKLETWQIGRLEKLFGAYWDELGWGSGFGAAIAYATPTNLVNAAAFQLAVWEIVNETSQYAASQYDVKVRNGAGFAVQQNLSNESAIEKANEWLKSLDNANLKSADLVALKSGTVQDFVYLTAISESISPPVPVPAPGAAGLILIGLGAISWVRRGRV